jgi:hypothetical protein
MNAAGHRTPTPLACDMSVQPNHQHHFSFPRDWCDDVGSYLVMSVAILGSAIEKGLGIGIGVQSSSETDPVFGMAVVQCLGSVSLFPWGPRLSPSFTLKMQELQGIVQERKDGGVR